MKSKEEFEQAVARGEAALARQAEAREAARLAREQAAAQEVQQIKDRQEKATAALLDKYLNDETLGFAIVCARREKKNRVEIRIPDGKTLLTDTDAYQNFRSNFLAASGLHDVRQRQSWFYSSYLRLTLEKPRLRHCFKGVLQVDPPEPPAATPEPPAPQKPASP